MAVCRYCSKDLEFPCRSTRDMEDMPRDASCNTALMLHGGGEMTTNRLRSEAFVETLADPDQAVHASIVVALTQAGLLTLCGGKAVRTPAGEAAMDRIRATT